MLDFVVFRFGRYLPKALARQRYLTEPPAIRGGGLSSGADACGIEPSITRWPARSACSGASFCPQSGQISRSADMLPTSRVVAFCSTVTSVRTVRPVP